MVSGLLRHLDSAGLWTDADAVEAALGIVQQACGEEHQQYMLYSEFVRHLGSEALTLADQKVRAQPSTRINMLWAGFQATTQAIGQISQCR